MQKKGDLIVNYDSHENKQIITQFVVKKNTVWRCHQSEDKYNYLLMNCLLNSPL